MFKLADTTEMIRLTPAPSFYTWGSRGVKSHSRFVAGNIQVPLTMFLPRTSTPHCHYRHNPVFPHASPTWSWTALLIMNQISLLYAHSSSARIPSILCKMAPQFSGTFHILMDKFILAGSTRPFFPTRHLWALLSHATALESGGVPKMLALPWLWSHFLLERVSFTL